LLESIRTDLAFLHASIPSPGIGPRFVHTEHQDRKEILLIGVNSKDGEGKSQQEFGQDASNLWGSKRWGVVFSANLLQNAQPAQFSGLI
jgi:hypothetical protein